MIQEAHPALAPERRDRIRSLVREGGVARVEDLRKNLKVSVATIRRDLEILEEEGKVKRVHGGAVSMESRLENLSLTTRLVRQVSRKKELLKMHLIWWGMRSQFFLMVEAPLCFLPDFLSSEPISQWLPIPFGQWRNWRILDHGLFLLEENFAGLVRPW